MSSCKSVLFEIETRGDKYSQKQNKFDVIDQRPFHSPTNIRLDRSAKVRWCYSLRFIARGAGGEGITILHADSFKTTCVSRTGDDNRP